MKHKLAFIPLDNRPCCFKFPKRLAEIGGFDLLHPPEEWLGVFTQPGDCTRIAHWLEETSDQVDGVVIALDQLAYGGLVASRTMDRTLDQCLETLQVIRRLREQFPKLKIFVANVLMRISITIKNAQFGAYWASIFQYSQLYDRVHRLGDQSAQDDLERVKNDIPPALLAEYLEARERNHTINRLMIDWVAEGMIDFLIITQEDASEFGLHVSEQYKLMQHMYDKQVQSKVIIYPGADEATQTLLARMIQELSGRKVKIYPHYLSTQGKMTVAKYEDRPVEESVKSHVWAAGAVCTDSPQDADLILFVNTPSPDVIVDGQDHQLKAYFDSKRNLWAFVESMRHYMAEEKPVAVADLAFPNASDMELVRFLLSENLYYSLAAYAGWNTAGNSLGTCISHAVLRSLYIQHDQMDVQAEEAHLMFLAERLLDEWAYQAQVRQKVNQWISDHTADDPTCLEHEYHRVNAQVVAQMEPYIQEVRNHLQGYTFDSKSRRLICQKIDVAELRLPWNRTFEIDVTLTGDVQELNHQSRTG